MPNEIPAGGSAELAAVRQADQIPITNTQSEAFWILGFGYWTLFRN